ncbi:hypothetical protein ACJJTC_016554 [Scirpophaga incertulas]
MEDSYIIANFHTLCRLCLNKSMFAVSIFGAAPDDENNISLTSKIAECFELQDSQKPKPEEYIVEDSVVMVVDPSLDYDSSEDSDTTEQAENEPVEQDVPQDGFIAGHKPHVCPLCPRSFVANGDLQKHILVHSSAKNYACQQCPQKFSRRDKLLKHELRHGPIVTPKNEMNNDHTNDMVVNVNPFSNLMTSPTQMNPDTAEYDLPRVPDHIAGESSFVNHSRNQNHGYPANNPSSSGKQLLSPSAKSKVLVKNKPKNIKCHQCPKRFSSLDAYKSHVSLAHIGSRVFQCKICFKKFSRKRELDRHSNVHSNMQSFECSECDKTFNRKDKLDKHEQTHECLVTTMMIRALRLEIKKEDDPDEYTLDDNLYSEGT